MSQIITFPLPTGTNYIIPDVGDENWGQNVTNFLVSIPDGVMPTSGTFTLTGDVSLGPTFGFVSQYFKSATVSPASARFLRLAKTDSLAWRNNANSGNLLLAIDGSDQLTFDGTPITVGGVTTITGTANQIIASAPTGAVVLSTPQDIAATSSPTFAGLTLSVPLTVPNGGTGASSFTAYSVVCGGTTSTNPLQSVSSVGLSGQFLQSQGAGMLPTWANAAGTGTVNSGIAGNFAYYATSTNAVSDSGVSRTIPSFSNVITTGASLQLEIRPGGGSNKAIILTASNPAADRTYTLPDRGANDTFAFLGAQAQTFTGLTTLNNPKLGANLDANSNKIVSLSNATAAQDAVAFGQVQYAFQTAVQATDNTTHAITSSSFQSLFSVSFTPTSASSRIKITVTLPLVDYTGASTGTGRFSVFRDSTDTAPSTGGWASYAPSSLGQGVTVTFYVIDSPATTSAISYSVRAKTTAGTLNINKTTADYSRMLIEELR